MSGEAAHGACSILEGAGLGYAQGQVGVWCMLIYALTGRLWTVLFVRAIPTIFF